MCYKVLKKEDQCDPPGGPGKDMVVTNMHSFTGGALCCNCTASPFLWLLEVLIHKEKPRRSQQTLLEMCGRNEACPPRGVAVRNTTASRVRESPL